MVGQPGTRPLFIGIDLGTSGCRACAIDAEGSVAGIATTPLPTSMRAHGTSEQAPAAWWQAVLTALDQLLAQIPGERVHALAVDGTSATVLLTDAEGTPLGPALMYDDSRSRTEAQAVAAVAPADSPARGPGSSLAKLLHLRSLHRDARHALHQADWIAGRLAGHMGFSDENNALKLGYDPVRRQWPDWLTALDIPSALLPTVRPPGTPIGLVAEPLRQRLHLPAEALVVAGTTDSTAAFLATGAARPGDAVTSLGSTLVLKVLSDKPVFAARYGVYSHRLDDLWLVGGASNSGGAVLLQYFQPGDLERLTPQLQPDQPTTLDYYPLPGIGERFPVNDPDLNPRLEPRPQDPARFFQGLLEGITAIEARGYALLAELGAPAARQIYTVGGGAINPAWRRIRQRVLGIPLPRPLHEDAAYGAAMLARRGADAQTTFT